MSLFSSFEQGDIWASNGFAFASPINDMLEKEHFTLTELLDEDEVLQEVKSLNPKLITFLATPESVRQMVQFMTVPAAFDDDDRRKLKYPYMSCEVLCCEVPSILATLADTGAPTNLSGSILTELFAMLEADGPVDVRLAGYLEKVVAVLLKHKCLALVSHINAGGFSLFKRFAAHLDDFSITQIVRRLLLPKLASLQEIDALAWQQAVDAAEGLAGEAEAAAALAWVGWGTDERVLLELVGTF
ncbi:unnamed protein product, partial [Phaeothamnion confervicola]